MGRGAPKDATSSVTWAAPCAWPSLINYRGEVRGEGWCKEETDASCHPTMPLLHLPRSSAPSALICGVSSLSCPPSTVGLQTAFQGPFFFLFSALGCFINYHSLKFLVWVLESSKLRQPLKSHLWNNAYNSQGLHIHFLDLQW